MEIKPVRTYRRANATNSNKGSTRDDLAGQHFGKLTVIGISETARHGRLSWDCQCDCGKAKICTTQDLKTRNVQSCGCLVAESAKRRAHWAKVGPELLAALEAVLPWLGKALADEAFRDCVAPRGATLANSQALAAVAKAKGAA